MSDQDKKPVAVMVRGEVWNADNARYERKGKFFEIHIFEVDKNGDPVIVGTTKLGKKEFEKHKITATLRLPESCAMNLITGVRNSAPLWLAPKKW